jgi:hypothetical protein
MLQQFTLTVEKNMKIRKITRGLILGLSLASISLLTACSYFADFVVVNDSDHPIEVRYKVTKSPAGPLAISGIPAIIKASQLDTHGGQQWKELTPAQYHLIQDSSTETVIVGLMPNEALRVTKLHDYGGHEDPRPNIFAIEEIGITGASGEMKLVGEKARTSFDEVSSALYILTYK